MRRKLNVKLLGITAAALFVLALAGHFLHAYQLRQNAYRLRDLGDRAAADKQFDKALRYYAQYLSFVGGDADAIQKYAEALDVAAVTYGERVELVLKMEQVLRIKPNEHALRLRLVHNLIWLDRIPEAIAQLSKLKDAGPDKAEVQHMLGWCEDATQRYAEAARAFEEAIRLDPRRIVSYALLAEVQQERLHEPDAAQKTVDDMIAANPKAYDAYLARARFLRKRGDDKAAASDLEEAYKLGGNHAEVLFEIADVARASGNWEEATRLLKEAMKRFPDNADFIRMMAGVELAAGKTEAAIDHLRSGMRRSPHAHELAILLTELLIDQKRYAEAGANIADLEKAGLKPTVPHYLKARLLFAEKDYRAAIRLLEEIRVELPAAPQWSGRVHLLLGLCYREIGQRDLELEEIRRAVEDEPTWTAAGIDLGLALLASGRFDEALAVLEPMRKAPELPAAYWNLLARARLARLNRQPIAQRRYAEVEDALRQAEIAEPGNIETPIARAELLALGGDVAAARAALEKARDAQPKSVALWSALADLEASDKQFIRADKILQQALAACGDQIDIRLAQCRIWTMANTADALRKLDQLGKAMPASYSVSARARLYGELARSWAALGKTDRVDNAWRHVARELPKDTQSRFALAELALWKNQFDAARQLRDELRAIEGSNGWLWRYVDAAMLVQEAHGDRALLAEARKKLEEIEKIRNDWPRTALLSAGIYEMQGQYPAAVQEYLRAGQLGDMPAATVTRLLQLLRARRDFSKAETVLARYEQRHAFPPEIARLGAEIALGLRDGRYAAIAVGRAEQAVPMPVRDYRDAVWLAKIYQSAGQTAKAEKLLADTLARDPQAPDVWIAWLGFLQQTGQRLRGVAEIDKMKAVMPNTRAPLAWARGLETLGETARASQAYRDALAASPKDAATLFRAAEFYRRTDQPGLAEESYRRLLEPSLHAPTEFAVIARRQLAVLVAPRNATEALALLDDNKQGLSEASADERVRWFVQSFNPSARSDAISQFEESLRNQSATPEERLLLARMLESADTPQGACEQLAEAVDEAPYEPSLIVPYVRLLVRTGDEAQARRLLARLEQIEPGSARTQALRAELGR